jgi:hypothetical protein
MSANVSPEFSRARRAYELGRLRSSTWRALAVALAIAALGVATTGWSSLAALPVTLSIWIFAYWRGDVLLRGGLYGLVGGIVTSLLPMSILRPCCATGMPPGADCCTMPGACLAAGAVVGVALAMVVPFAKRSWWRTALGVSLGMTSVAVLKCATLVAGESLGLLGGLLVGVAAAGAARSLLSRRATT